MKLLIALVVVATVLDLSLSASSDDSLKGREFSRNRRSSGAVPTVSVQANAEKLDQFLINTFRRSSPPLRRRVSLSGGWSSSLAIARHIQVPGGSTASKVGEDMHDVILVLDSSGSIGSSEFNKAKQFMVDIVSLLNSIATISRDKTRIACISFSEAHKIITEFGFLKYTSESSVIQAIKPIKYHSGGSTHTARALKRAKYLFETTGRAGAKKTLIIATDGQSNGGGDPAVPARQMKDPSGLDVTIFVAAVSNVNVQEVEAIASSPDHVRDVRAARAAHPYVIYVDSFNQALRVTDAVRKLQLSRRLQNNPRLAGIHSWLTQGLAQ